MVTAAMKLKDTYSLGENLWSPRQHIKKQKCYFANKGPTSQSYVFPVVMYGCENSTIKKAECWRIDAFELCCWRRPLRVPWTTRRFNQSILKEISPEYSLEGLMLKLKLQYSGYLIQTAESLEKTLMVGKTEGRRRRGRQRIRWLDGWMASRTQWTLVWVNSRSWWWTGRPGMLQFMGLQRVGHDWVLNWLTDWIEIIITFPLWTQDTSHNKFSSRIYDISSSSPGD